MLSSPPAPAAAPPRRRERRSGPAVTVLRLAVRLAVVVVLYLVYAFARNDNGLDAAAAEAVAQDHAADLVRLQEVMRLPSEQALQALVLDQTWLVRASGAFYGTAHFAVTVGLLVLLAVRRPAAFDRWATALAATTFVAVSVFVLYPVAPPRLAGNETATVDTLATVGGVWSYDHGVLERISDPYAALPSLHLAWATWCGLVLWHWGAGSPRRRAWRTAGVAHVVLTLVSVLVTGNHWHLDVVAGVALAAGVVVVQARLLRPRQPQAEVALRAGSGADPAPFG